VAAFDVYAPGVAPTKLEVTGPALKLILRNNAEGHRIVTADLLPSSWVGDYLLTTSTKDGAGGTTTRRMSITYAPGDVAVTTAKTGDLWIPAVAHNFRSSTRLNPITTETWKLPDGTLLSGTQELRVSMHKDSTVPLMIAGVRIDPGDVGVSLGNYDFSAAGGKVSLPAMAAEEGREGQSRIWITTTAPNSPAVDLRVHVWMPHVALTASPSIARQAFDPVTALVQGSADNRCSLTTRRETAKSGDMLAAPKCLIEWDPLPSDLSAVTTANPTAQGRMWVAGQYTVGYKISLVDEGDVLVPISSSTASITVTPIGDLLSYEPHRSSNKAYRMVQPVQVTMNQSKGPTCDTYWSVPDAEYRSSPSIVRCAITWTTLPPSLAQNPYWIRPFLEGTIDSIGDQTTGWSVDVITPLGARIPAGVGNFSYHVVEPPVPTITEDMLHVVKDGLYAVSREGGYAGNVVIDGANATYRVKIVRNGETVEDGEFDASPWGEEQEIVRRVNDVEAPLWSRSLWNVTALYSLMPENKSEKTFETLAVPADNIKPIASVDENVTLDTNDLPVKVSIRNIYNQSAGYDATTMGDWDVRLVKYIDYKTTEPLTDFTAAPTGDVSFTLPAGTLSKGYLRLTAEARLKSPVPEYQRMERSTNPLSLTVLKGGAIGADLTTRRLTGVAPFTTVISLTLEDRLDSTALGDVVWKMRSDGGAFWSDITPTKNNKLRLSHTFQKGEYDVKAILKNKYSGAIYETETLHIIAYDVPLGAMDGPENVFIGANAHYKISLTHNGEEVTNDKVFVEWSIDGGDTFTKGNMEYDMTRQEEARVLLIARARLLDAPEEDPFAWRELRRRVNFVKIRPPMARVVGPARVEYPKTAEFKGVMGLPYRNMDVTLRGWWTLPDGTRVDGTALTWGPTAEDIAADTVTLTFHADIVGFDGTEASEDKRVRVWEYLWPEFRVEPVRSSQYAPATVTARLRQVGRQTELDHPTYDWTTPAAAEVLEDGSPMIRVVRTPTSGAYDFAALVADARGHSSSVRTTVNMLKPPDYAMSLALTASNPYNRAPLDVTVRPTITGGHPNDRIKALTYSVDGQKVGTSGSYARVTVGEGEHVVSVNAETTMGWTFGAEKTVTAVANKPPICAVSGREWTSGWLYTADCRDADGRIIEYRWTMDGDALALNSNRISVSKFNRDEPPLVTLSGVDDSGSSSEPCTAEIP